MCCTDSDWDFALAYDPPCDVGSDAKAVDAYYSEFIMGDGNVAGTSLGDALCCAVNAVAPVGMVHQNQTKQTVFPSDLQLKASTGAEQGGELSQFAKAFSSEQDKNRRHSLDIAQVTSSLCCLSRPFTLRARVVHACVQHGRVWAGR